MAKIFIVNTTQVVANAGCLASDAVGDFVYATPPVLGVPQVAKADILSLSKMPSIGVIIQKLTATTCIVLYEGIWTPGPVLVPNKRYWIGSTGTFTDVRPAAPAFLQLVAQAIDDTRLLVKPELDMTKVI